MGDQRQTVSVPIVEVTLLEDRAQVVRRARLDVQEGPQRLVIDGVAPVLADQTLLVAVQSGQARAVDAKVARRWVFRGPDDVTDETETLIRLRGELEALVNAIRECEEERNTATRSAGAFATTRNLALRELAEDVAWGRDDLSDWGSRLDALQQNELGERSSVGALIARLSKLRRARQRKTRRIDATGRLDEHAHADLEIDLLVESSGAIELRIDYVVPNACWRPYHTAQLSEGATDSVVFATDACVWQNTGEDWRDVQLILSTERASLGAEPPKLASDVLFWQRRSEVIEVEARDQTVDTSGLGVGRAEETGAPELPGIDDGGEPLALQAPSLTSVPSDGRPWRVRLGEFESDAEREHVAFPELNPGAIVRTTLTNRGEGPVLAGPVDLIANSGFVGRTSVLFHAPGERFELGWGPDPDVRIHRELEESDEKSRALSAWYTQSRVVTLRLSNLGAESRKVTVTERVPISEIEKVKIELSTTRTSGEAQPDENGFVTWTVELGPRGRAKRVLAYQLKRHESVVGV